MVKADLEEDFRRLLQLVEDLWLLMGDETVACVRDCLAVFSVSPASADTSLGSQLWALQQHGLLSPHSVLVLRQVSELVGCGGALRLLADFERNHPPSRGRPARAVRLSAGRPASAGHRAQQPSPTASDDSFKTATDCEQESRAGQRQPCPWQWPPPLRRSVSDVLERPWDEPESSSSAQWRTAERPSPARPPPQQQMNWLEKVLTWKVRDEPAEAPRSRPVAKRASHQRRSRDSSLLTRDVTARVESILTSESSSLLCCIACC